MSLPKWVLSERRALISRQIERSFPFFYGAAACLAAASAWSNVVELRDSYGHKLKLHSVIQRFWEGLDSSTPLCDGCKASSGGTTHTMLLRCHQAATCSVLHKSNRTWLPIASNLHAAQQPCCLPALDTIHGSSSCCSSSGSTSSTRSNWQASLSRPHNSQPNVHKHSTKLSAKDAGAAGSLDDEDDVDSIKPGKPLRVERLLANLGYGKRKECTVMIKRKQLVYADTRQPAKVWC